VTSTPRVLAAIVATVVSWGAAFVAIRHAAPEYPPGAFLFLRFLIPALLLGAIAVRGGTLVPPAGSRLAAFAVGLSFVAYLAFLVIGEKTVDAGTSSMVVETSPLFTCLLGVLFLRDRAPPHLVVGLGVAFTGAAMIAYSQAGGFTISAGVVFVFAAALSQAVMVVVQKPLLGRATATEVVTWATIAGAVMTLPFAGQLVGAIGTAPRSATVAIVFVALTTGAISYITLAYVIGHAPSAASGSSILFLVPPIAFVIAWITLGEKPRLLAVIGGFVALVGVVVARREPRP